MGTIILLQCNEVVSVSRRGGGLSLRRPRYIVLPIEDVDLSALVGQTLPVYRMPGLMRQARQVEEAELRDSQPAGSSGYAAPAGPAGPDHVDYGAYTGGYGAFGWYTDHPVSLGPH